MATPKGRPPVWTAQRRLCQAIIGKEGTKEYDEYCKTMRRHILAGIVPPVIHQLILHYGYGKPVEELEVEIKHEDSMAGLSETELRDRARRIAMARYIIPPDEATGAINGEVVRSELTSGDPDAPSSESGTLDSSEASE